jgi:hypothetical protein
MVVLINAVSFMQPHKKKLRGVTSGDLKGQKRHILFISGALRCSGFVALRSGSEEEDRVGKYGMNSILMKQGHEPDVKINVYGPAHLMS